jgi:hypothetical protein
MMKHDKPSRFKGGRYLGVSKSFLDKLRCYGGGPTYAKLGATDLYTTADLYAWAASKRVAANDDRL